MFRSPVGAEGTRAVCTVSGLYLICALAMKAQGQGFTLRDPAFVGFEAQPAHANYIPFYANNIAAWYHADGITGLASGTTITTWLDDSWGQRNHVGTAWDMSVNVAGHGPAWTANVLNGQPAVYFASSQWLMNATPMWSGNQPRTIVALYTAGSVEGVDPIYGQCGGSAVGSWFMMQSRDTGATGDPYFCGYANDVSGATGQSGFWRYGTIVYDGAIMTTYANGGVYGGPYSKSLNTTASSMFMGADWQGIATAPEETAPQLYIFEVIVFNEALSDASREEVEGYLVTKYGL